MDDRTDRGQQPGSWQAADGHWYSPALLATGETSFVGIDISTSTPDGSDRFELVFSAQSVGSAA